MSEVRSNFTGKIGFVFAAAGSAVGLGNIWRFPYLAAEYGGGIFLFVYVVLALTLGFTLLCAEIAIGRKTGKSAIGAFKDLNKKFSFVGWIASIVPMLILPYYSVIGGWVTKYIVVFCSGNAHAATKDDYFNSFRALSLEPSLYFILFIGITALVVLFGVEKGIEKVSKFMMPLLVALTLFIAIYSLFMPNAIQGLIYYIKPDFSKFSATTVLAAMGQLFYSMSLAMGIMITYGSYMKKEISIESSVSQIELFDTGIAFLAGLMVIPSVFTFSEGKEEVLKEGTGLMFVTLPKIFDTMIGGTMIGAAFFILVFFAALTSSISLMETVVSILHDKLGWGRKKTCLVVLLGCLAIGIPTSLGFGVLSFIQIAGFNLLGMFDFISNNVLMPVVAFCTCIFVGFVMKPTLVTDEIELTGEFKRKKVFNVVIKYIAPICIVLILISSILNALNIIKI